MLGDRNTVFWLDPANKIHTETTVEMLYRNYVQDSHRVDSNSSYIEFGDEGPLVSDGTGFTKILRIDVVEVEEKDHEFRYVTAKNHSLRITADTLIPAFMPEEYEEGFHGQIKIKFRAAPIEDFKSNERLMICDGTSFAIPEANKLVYSHPKVSLYKFTTKSGFMNVEEIMMFASDRNLGDIGHK